MSESISPSSASGAGAARWTEERVAQLFELQEKGLSGSAIAKIMGETRNAVMGKLHRNGRTCGSRPPGKRSAPPRNASTNGRGTVQRVEAAKVRANFAFPAPKAKPKAAPTKEPALVPIFVRPPEAIPTTACDIDNLTNETCRWPFGDPAKLYCGTPGADLAADIPYCGFHTRMAYTPARGRL